jgi:pimeloyl-ACP methyl ester carboxylesterase
LTGVRFAFDTAFRVRLQLEGHRTVNIREHVFWSKYFGPLHPVINLDRDEDLPEEMVRVRGFAHDLVDYEDFFLDRYEVTNRQYEEFVSSGGYEDPSYWTERFVDNGQLVTWNVAIQSFVDTTGRPGPANWQGGTYPNGQADFPVNGISWYEAAAFANFLGKELPTVEHLRSALPFYRWEGGIMAAQSNLGSQSIRPVGQNRAMSAVGIFDLIGNVREWNSNEAIDGNRVAFGGGWSDPPYFDNHLTVLSPWDRDSANGIRLIRTFDSKEKLARLNTPQLPVERRDFRVLEPVSDGDFEIFRRLYAYDSLPLNTNTTELREFEHWNRERVEFDLPGGDRGGAILYLPRNSMPPFKTVIHWPPSSALAYQSVDDSYLDDIRFMVRSGHAVVQPLFLGTYDETPKSTSYRDIVITWVQEYSRTIDFVETREDLSFEPLAFFGFSWGGDIAGIPLSIDDRVNFAVLVAGAIDNRYHYLPEADPFNYISRAMQPVLIINGEFDNSILPTLWTRHRYLCWKNTVRPLKTKNWSLSGVVIAPATKL